MSQQCWQLCSARVVCQGHPCVGIWWWPSSLTTPNLPPFSSPSTIKCPLAIASTSIWCALPLPLQSLLHVTVHVHETVTVIGHCCSCLFEGHRNSGPFNQGQRPQLTKVALVIQLPFWQPPPPPPPPCLQLEKMGNAKGTWIVQSKCYDLTTIGRQWY
jgi:hypothetical protein